MEAILNLNIREESTSSVCFFCRKPAKKGKRLVECKCFASLQQAAALRKLKQNPPQFKCAITRIEQNEDDSIITYHSSCHATFTSKEMINRLPDLHLSNVEHKETLADNNSNATIWTECILCQQHTKEHLRKITVSSMEEKIRNLAKTDSNLNSRIGGDSIDLIANTTMYHTNCLNRFSRNSNMKQSQGSMSTKPNHALKEICSELYMAAEKGEVLRLCDVWIRYTSLAEELNEEVPNSFITRRSTFKDKLIELLDGVYQFYQPLNVDIENRQMLLIPTKYQFSLVTNSINNDFNPSEPISGAASHEDPFIGLVHTALRIHSDLRDTSGHKGLDVSEEAARKIVPDSLFMLLSILSRGQNSLDEMLEAEDTDSDQEDEDEDEDECNKLHYDRKNNFNKKILSIAQDIIFLASKGKKLTPKHIGLTLAMHQMTRNRKLVTLFSKAGHCLPYPKMLKIDNTLAELTLSTLDYSTGAVVPANFQPVTLSEPNQSNGSHQSILQLTIDNIDILTDTIDGKKSFHAAQVVAFQRGALSSANVLNQLEIKKTVSFRIPEILNQLPPDPIVPPIFTPKFSKPVKLEWYKRNTDIPDNLLNAKAADLSFLLTRQNETEGDRVGWTQFNQQNSTNNPDVTNHALLPLILNPAHEYSTLLLFLQRAISIADSLKHKYVVVTVDQALHLKLLQLKMADPVFQNRIIIKMGGLHLAMNYLKAIGQHMCDTGLSEIWRESGILGDGSIVKALEGKAYAKAMRAHKLTFQAMWRILTPRLLTFINCKSEEFHKKLTDNCNNIEKLVALLKIEKYSLLLTEFVDFEASRNVNFKFWWTYIESVTILLLFTRSIRDGKWDLELYAVKNMVPLMERYNHRNYVKSIALFLAEMNQLPDEVASAFKSGDFVIKATKGKFNQVDADHAQEWLVGTSKDSGGIVGITNNENTLQRWALSFGWRTEITEKTFHMYGLTPVSGVFNEGTNSRRKRDNSDELSILHVLNYFNVLQPVEYAGNMQNIVTKDVATEDIQKFLLEVAEDGEKKILQFVTDRLIGDENGEIQIQFDDPLEQNKIASMKKLYDTEPSKDLQVAQQKIIKSDRCLLQRLIMALEAGRELDLEKILERELFDLPLSLVDAKGDLRSGDNKALTNLLQKGILSVSQTSALKDETHFITTAQTLLHEITVVKLKTFGDLADIFFKQIEDFANQFSRIDIIFDRCNDNSLTAAKKQQTSQLIRRIIENRNVALPKKWPAFLAHPKNKEDLYRFLSLEVAARRFDDTSVVLSGRFFHESEVVCLNSTICIEPLICSQEEAVTRIILHAVNSKHRVIVVSACEMDIFELLIHHFDKIGCSELWLRAGTTKTRVYVPIHTICCQMPDLVKQNILAYHALTGSRFTSFFAGITKNGAWNIFKENASLLSSFGKSPLTPDIIQSAENFVVKLYKVGQGVKTTNIARYILFGNAKAPEFLPPTTDALVHHIKRSHYITRIWENAHNKEFKLESPLSFGWKINDNGDYDPILLSLEPVSNSCVEITQCGCKGLCSNKRCTCFRLGLGCTSLCQCTAYCQNNKKFKNLN